MRLGTLALAAHMLLAGSISPALAQNTDNTARRRGEPVTLNFQNAEIESIARTIAVISGRDVVLDPRVKGTMTLVTDRPVTPAAALNQFAAALRLQSYAIVEADGLYKIVPETEAKLQGSAVTVSTEPAGTGGNQVMTQIFKLNHESANMLLPVLRPLITQNNTINANPSNNSLVITDYAENLRRIARIVAALDVPNASDVEVIPLRHSVASDLAPLVMRLVEGGSSTGSGAPIAPGQTADASFRTTILADSRSNSLIVRAANPVRAQLVRTLVTKLDRPPLNTGNGEAGNIYVVHLKNADAVRLAITLRAAIASDATLRSASNNPTGSGLTGAAAATAPAPNSLGSALGLNNAMGGADSPANAPVNNANMPSTGGQVQADPSTNSLIITASEPQYRQLRAVIDKLDGRRAQVLVECLIAEVNADRAAEFGIQWQSALGNGNNHNVGVIGTNSNLAGPSIIGLAAAAATRDPTLATMPASGLNFGIASKIGGQYVLSFLARFLEGNKEGNVLSTPNLLTLDNEEAKIVIGQNVPFITGQYTNAGLGTNTVNPFQTYERKDVGLTLRVRPQINENNTVKLTLYQEVSTIAANSLSGPTTNKRSIESSVMVDDGSIVVLGGLLQDEYSGGVEKVPLLGDIPLIGNLFKSETRTRKKTNLMVFLRPVVIRDNAASDALTYDRYDAIRTLQIGAQPNNQNLMLRNVPDSNILPTLPLAPSGADRSIEGTRLVPPPLAAGDVRLPGSMNSPINSLPNPPDLNPGPLRGALPPTNDPASARELP